MANDDKPEPVPLPQTEDDLTPEDKELLDYLLERALELHAPHLMATVKRQRWKRP
jgi:hypothetical protein